MVGALRKAQVAADHLRRGPRVTLANHKGALAVVTRFLDHAFQRRRRPAGTIGKDMPPTAGNQYDIAWFKNDIAAGREAHMAAALDHKMEPRGLLISWNGNGPRWRAVGPEVKCSFE